MHRLMFLAIFILCSKVTSSRKSLPQADVGCGSDSSCLLLSSKPASPPNIQENIPIREINTWYPIPKWKVFFDIHKNSEGSFASYFNKLDPRRADGNAHANHFPLTEERTQKRKVPRKVRIQYLPSNKWNNANITKLSNGKGRSAGIVEDKNNKTLYVPPRTGIVLLGLTPDNIPDNNVKFFNDYFVNRFTVDNSNTINSLNNTGNDAELLRIKMPITTDVYQNVDDNNKSFKPLGIFSERIRFQSWKTNSTVADLSSDFKINAEEVVGKTGKDISFQRGYLKNNYTHIEKLGPYQVTKVNEPLPILIATIHLALPKKNMYNLLYKNTRQNNLQRLTSLDNDSENNPAAVKPILSVSGSEIVSSLQKRIRRNSEWIADLNKTPTSGMKLSSQLNANIHNETTFSAKVLRSDKNASDIRDTFNDTNYDLWIKLKKENMNPLINSVLMHSFPHAMNSGKIRHKEKNILRNRRFMWHEKSDNTLFSNFPRISNQAETLERNKSEVTLLPLNSNEESGENYSVFEAVAEHTKKSELQIDRVDLLDEDTWGFEMKTGARDPLKTDIKDAPIPSLRNIYNVSSALKNNSDDGQGKEKRRLSFHFDPVINEYNQIEGDRKTGSVANQNDSFANYYEHAQRIQTPFELFLKITYMPDDNIPRRNPLQILNVSNTSEQEKVFSYNSDRENQNVYNLEENMNNPLTQDDAKTLNNMLLLRREREVEDDRENFDVLDPFKYVSNILPQMLLMPTLTSAIFRESDVRNDTADGTIEGFKAEINHTNYNYIIPKPVTLVSGIISVLDRVNIPEINNTFKHISSKHTRSLESSERNGDNMFANNDKMLFLKEQSPENIQRRQYFGGIPSIPFLRPTNSVKSWLQSKGENSRLPIKIKPQVPANVPVSSNNEQSGIRWYITAPNEQSISISDSLRNIFNPLAMKQREVETHPFPSKSWEFNNKKCKPSKQTPFKPFMPKWKDVTSHSPEKVYGADYEFPFPFNAEWQDGTAIKSPIKTSQVDDMAWKNTQWTFIEPIKKQPNKKHTATTKRPWEIINVAPVTPENKIRNDIWPATQPWVFNQWIFPSGHLEPQVTTPMMMMGMGVGD